jgi:hypothetical protein
MVAAWTKIAILVLKASPASKKTAATPPKRLLRASKCLDCRRAHRGWGILQEAHRITIVAQRSQSTSVAASDYAVFANEVFPSVFK